MSKSYKFNPDDYDNAYAVRQMRREYNLREDRKIEAQLRKTTVTEQANG